MLVYQYAPADDLRHDVDFSRKHLVTPLLWLDAWVRLATERSQPKTVLLSSQSLFFFFPSNALGHSHHCFSNEMMARKMLAGTPYERANYWALIGRFQPRSDLRGRFNPYHTACTFNPYQTACTLIPASSHVVKGVHYPKRD